MRISALHSRVALVRPLLAGALVWFALSGPVWAEPPKVRELLVQRTEDGVTYFHVRLQTPADISVPPLQPGPYSTMDRRNLALLPQLVPQDDATSSVYLRCNLPGAVPRVQFDPLPRVPPIEGLEFVGKVQELGKTKLLLLYPTAETDVPKEAKNDKEDPVGLMSMLRPMRWKEAVIELDLEAAAQARQRGVEKNLEELWARGQANRFAILESLAPEAGFFGFACAATGRKYGVPDPFLERNRVLPAEQTHRRMLDLSTGATHITQSLALHRFKDKRFRDYGPRRVHISTVPGINIAEHPWEKMMGDKRPGVEPLATLTPHDNYYLAFKNFRKFLEWGDLLEQFGTPGGQLYEGNSRATFVKDRYEQQLCLETSWVGRTLGPLLIRSVAITGSDPYWREGTDVTVMFHVSNRKAFLAGVNGFLEKARKKFGKDLEESVDAYRGITIERFVTPLREVSMHRAAFKDFVVYSNSPVGLQRVLDTHLGRHKSLWDSLDFQYMRTVFRVDDKEEDGFAFLSDAFIRQLVSPASKIKEMRRLEALTSLDLITHGAMFTAWETGGLPKNHQALLDTAQLRPEHLHLVDDQTMRWDARKQVAVSDVYNTRQFATPLIELPIDKITRLEDETYRGFRQEYMDLWRQFFDPIGIRLALTDKQAKMEVYVLPLIAGQDYGSIRWLTGGDVYQFAPATISPKALGQFTCNLSILGPGSWGMIRLDDSPALVKLAQFWVLSDLHRRDDSIKQNTLEALALHLPFTLGIGHGKNAFLGTDWLYNHALNQQPVNKSTREYRDVTIRRLDFGAESPFLTARDEVPPPLKLKEASLFYAKVGQNGYLSLSESAVKDLIKRTQAQEKQKLETVPINASIHISPKAAQQARPALDLYLEWETHKRAVPNTALWHALYRCRLIDAKSTPAARQEAALKFLGFVPISPDDAAFTYDRARDEVVSERHGTLRRPTFAGQPADSSPFRQLLEQFPSMRADMRFREDGLHATLTLERKEKAKK